MSEARLRELFARLKRIRGKFLMSFDDAPIVRELSRGLSVRPVSVLYSLASTRPKKVPELLISNYRQSGSPVFDCKASALIGCPAK